MDELKTQSAVGSSEIVGLHRRLSKMVSEAEDIYAELRVRKLNRASKNCEIARCWLVAVKDNLPKE